MATAFANGWDTFKPQKPNTIAKSLAIGNPADGTFALEAVRRSGGAVGGGHRRRDRRRHPPPRPHRGHLRRDRRRRDHRHPGQARRRRASSARDERVVAYITGNGLKTVDAVAPHVGPTATIDPTLDAFAAAVEAHAIDLGDSLTMATVRIPTQLRPLTGGQGTSIVDGDTVGAVLKALDAAHPGFAERLFDDAGAPPPLRQRVRRRRGRPLPRRPRHRRRRPRRRSRSSRPSPAAEPRPILTSMPDVLVVDDDEIIRGMVAFLFETEGYTVAQAADGQQALDRLAGHAPR